MRRFTIWQCRDFCCASIRAAAVELEPFRYYEEPEPTDYESLDAELDTRAANDGDDARKEKP